MFYHYYDTPAGTLLLTSDGTQLTGMHWKVFKDAPVPTADWKPDSVRFAATISELDDYFAGKRRDFSVPYKVHGTPFQQAVWAELEKIPYGKTTTYQAIATAIGKPKAVRAVGTAIGHNPMCIAVPCHRVLATSGGLGGYAGGLESKQLLLGIEKAAAI